MRRWVALLGCFIGMGVATPAILLVPMGLFLKPMTTEFGWSRTGFSALLSIAALVNAIILPVAGYLVDRFKAPRVIAVGTLLGCGSYAALSQARSYGGFVAIMAVSVAMGNLASYPAFMGLARRWFDKRLGLALALTSTGLAVGTGVSSRVIAGTIQSHGWRAAFATVGIGALVIGLLNLLAFVRDNDGQLPQAERRGGPAIRDDEGETLGSALRSRDFWLYAVGFSIIVFSFVGCTVQLPALLSDRGASAATVASVVALVAAGSLIARLATGLMLDRFSVLGVAGVSFLGQVLAFLLLLDGLRWVLLAGFLLGLIQGAEIDLLGFVVARRFGRSSYARILGACFSVTLIGAVLGPLAMASIFDRTGSYAWGLRLLPLLTLLAFGLLCMTRMSRGASTGPVMPRA